MIIVGLSPSIPYYSRPLNVFFNLIYIGFLQFLDNYVLNCCVCVYLFYRFCHKLELFSLV